jgi:Cdc6-like AAA superfamily ATPase
LHMKVKNMLPLTDDFQPPVLLYRDEQLQRMLQLTTSGYPENLWLEGDKGLGKTLTCKHFASELEARGMGKAFFMQCTYSLGKSMEKMRDDYHLDISKRSLSPSSIASAIVKKYPQAPLITLIIEEPEECRSWRDIRRFTHALYNALLEQCGRLKFNICFTSRVLYVNALKELEGEHDSRLQLRPMLFPAYNEEQIVGILKQRLTYAFENMEVYDEEALRIIARHVARVGSDIREALEILRHSIELAADKLTVNVAKVAVEWGKDMWWAKQMYGLPPHVALTLYLAAEEALKNEGSTTAVTVLNRYEQYLRERKMSVGRRTFYYILSKLSEKGFFTQERKAGFGSPAELVFHLDDAKRIVKVGEKIDWHHHIT